MSKDKRLKILSVERKYDGWNKLDLYTVQHQRFDGTWTKPFTREVIDHGSASAVLLYDAHQDAVVVVEQMRLGAFIAGCAPWQCETVAGLIDEGETPADAARREAMEESGYSIGRLEKVGELIACPGILTEIVHIFVGEIQGAADQTSHGVAAEDEDIRTHFLPVAEVFSWVEDGRPLTAPVYALVVWLQLHHQELRSKWLNTAPDLVAAE